MDNSEKIGNETKCTPKTGSCSTNQCGFHGEEYLWCYTVGGPSSWDSCECEDPNGQIQIRSLFQKQVKTLKTMVTDAKVAKNDVQILLGGSNKVLKNRHKRFLANDRRKQYLSGM